MNHTKPLTLSGQEGTQRDLEKQRCEESLALGWLPLFTVHGTIHWGNRADIKLQKNKTPSTYFCVIEEMAERCNIKPTLQL